MKNIKTPEISVIIPLYNSEKYIKETIESVLSQGFKNFELIIIDDASTDNSLKITRELAKKDNRIRLFKSKTNKGRASSINVGLRNAKAQYITFLDSDDIMYPGRLKKQMFFLKNHPEIDMIYGDILKFWENGTKKIYNSVEFSDTEEPLKRLKKFAKGKQEIKEAYKALDKEKFIPGASIMFRRKIIDAGIKLDENLRNSEDCDFNFQIIKAGYKIAKYPIITFKYRIHKDQKSGNKEKMTIATQQITNKLRKSISLLPTSQNTQIIQKN